MLLLQCQGTSRILFRMGVFLNHHISVDVQHILKKISDLWYNILNLLISPLTSEDCIGIYLFEIYDYFQATNFFMRLHPSFCPLKCRFLVKNNIIVYCIFAKLFEMKILTCRNMFAKKNSFYSLGRSRTIFRLFYLKNSSIKLLCFI